MTKVHQHKCCKNKKILLNKSTTRALVNLSETKAIIISRIIILFRILKLDRHSNLWVIWCTRIYCMSLKPSHAQLCIVVRNSLYSVSCKRSSELQQIKVWSSLIKLHTVLEYNYFNPDANTWKILILQQVDKGYTIRGLQKCIWKENLWMDLW